MTSDRFVEITGREYIISRIREFIEVLDYSDDEILVSLYAIVESWGINLTPQE